MTTLELPVIDFTSFLNNPESAAAKLECAKAAEALAEFGAVAVKDPRVSEDENDEFLKLLETYFDLPFDDKLKDTRPQYGYQVGATPEMTEEPRCGRDENCLRFVENMNPSDKPFPFSQKDPKWRFFWRIGSLPPTTKYTNLNASQVIPSAFSNDPAKAQNWETVMNAWGGKLCGAGETFAEMICEGMGIPKTAISSLAKNGPHLLAPTGCDLTKFGQKDTVIAGFHTDLNCITVHGKSRFPGLYIWIRNGRRLMVKIPNGCLLVQAGKQLEHLTGGYISAGYHEVVVTPATIEAIARQTDEGRPLWRVSSTLFFHIASDQILKPLDGIKWVQEKEECKNKYAPILAGEQVLQELGVIKLI